MHAKVRESFSFLFSKNFLFLQFYLFIIYVYTVAVFRHTRRVHQIPLQMVVRHHVVARGSNLRTFGRVISSLNH